jgi:insulysin
MIRLLSSFTQVGSWSDPEDVLGLAHFCEHAVFLGSEAFPSEDGYDAWLSEHGGSYNAYTSDEVIPTLP